MTFEWDENKNNENIEKHNVSFDRAQKAFDDRDFIIIEDDEHSFVEERFFMNTKTTYKDDDARYTDAPPEVDAALDYAIKHN